VKRLLGG